MKLLKIIWLNLILEWNGLMRILKIVPDRPHRADIKLFLNCHQKNHYALNWVVWKINRGIKT